MARDIKAEVKKATAPKKGSAVEVKAAEAKGAKLRTKQAGTAATRIHAKETSRNRMSTGSATRVREVSTREHSKTIEKAAQKASPKPKAIDEAKLSHHLNKVGKALGAVTRGQHVISDTQRAKAKAEVRTVPKEAPKKGRGRPAKEGSVRSMRAARRAEREKKGINMRGPMASEASVAKKKALAEKAASRAAEGKSVRGRNKEATSFRGKRIIRADRGLQPMEDRTPAIKPTHSMRPSEVKAGYSQMPIEPNGDSATMSGEERGHHKAGRTTITYSAGGSQKTQRRSMKLAKGTAEVKRTLRADDESDRYKPAVSYRSMKGKDVKSEELLRHNSNPLKARRTKWTTTRSAAGLETSKMEVGYGRRSKDKKGKPKKLAPSTGANEGAASRISAHHREGYDNAMRGASRDRTSLSTNQRYTEAPERPKETREVAKINSAPAKKSMRKKSK